MKKIMLNQKSGMTYDDIKTYVTKLKIYQNKFTIFPTELYAKEFIENGYITGLQNIAVSNQKNQTGETTAKEAKSIGIKAVILGHSERRQNQHETDDELVKKFITASNENMEIVYCIGENLVDYKLKETETVLLNELNGLFNNIDLKVIKKLSIAYEPIWAIGTGIVPSNFEISKVAKFIRNYLNEKEIKASILYGGSVSDENIENLISIDEIDGFLVGGASNDYKKVIKICETAINSTK